MSLFLLSGLGILTMSPGYLSDIYSIPFSAVRIRSMQIIVSKLQTIATNYEIIQIE
jgi:hypothetical protein